MKKYGSHNKRVFVYGPLRFPEVMELIAGRQYPGTKATLIHYACVRVNDQIYPGLVHKTSAHTEGFLYEDVDDAVVKRIEAFKGDMYKQSNLEVNTIDDRKLLATVYVTKPEYRNSLLNELWNADAFRQNQLNEFLRIHADFQKKWKLYSEYLSRPQSDDGTHCLATQ